MNGLDVVFNGTALESALDESPCVSLYSNIPKLYTDIRKAENIQWKLEQACRKLCLMWQAGDWALEAEAEFYSSALKESPVLSGTDAVNVIYHLEAFVLFARSSCDVASDIFGSFLPPPFRKNRFDSFNKLTKKIIEQGPEDLTRYFQLLRDSETSWLSIISGSNRGRALRDLISHQIEFPIEYADYKSNTDKEYPIVLLPNKNWMPLDEFIRQLRFGVIDGFLKIEQSCCPN
jgi:hypothetical protein